MATISNIETLYKAVEEFGYDKTYVLDFSHLENNGVKEYSDEIFITVVEPTIQFDQQDVIAMLDVNGD